MLGIHHLEDSTTASLIAGTKAVLYQFVQGDEDKFTALHNRVILLNMDAAADEQLAGRLMACNHGIFLVYGKSVVIEHMPFGESFTVRLRQPMKFEMCFARWFGEKTQCQQQFRAAMC